MQTYVKNFVAPNSKSSPKLLITASLAHSLRGCFDFFFFGKEAKTSSTYCSPNPMFKNLKSLWWSPWSLPNHYYPCILTSGQSPLLSLHSYFSVLSRLTYCSVCFIWGCILEVFSVKMPLNNKSTKRIKFCLTFMFSSCNLPPELFSV